MFEKVLIANRGEIALRIHRACRDMGIRTVAVHATAEEHGFTFIGPSAEHIRLMGNKVAAKETASRLGIATVPGSAGAVRDLAAAEAAARTIGYPVLIKASAGGGGRGMKVARDRHELARMLPIAQNEAAAFFGSGDVYLERHLERPRHIEIQILGDGQGGIVHLGERDCSLQRSHQKVLEESPSPALNKEERDRLGALAVAALGELGYKSLGTLEFLYQDGDFFFIEMNTRLQVEHPITEMVSGLDLVREQLRIASGAPLGYRQADIKLRGHAIECRVNAENPDTFAPSPGRVTDYHAPGGLGVRVDSALYHGYEVPPYYDSLIAKLVIYGNSRNECLMRLRRALEEYVIAGIETTIPLHQRLVAAAEFIDGDYDVHWLERFVARAG